MSHLSIEERIREEALFGRLPLLKGEREYSTRGIISTGFTYAVAAWCFLIGGYSANVVGAVQGLITLICGCTIGVIVSAAASALACNRYGLEQIDYTKSCFGQRGARFILIFYIINQIGWTGMILVMFGTGVTNVAHGLGMGGGENLIRICVLAGLLVGYWVINRGVHVLNVFNSVVFPGLLVVTCFLYYAIFKSASWSQICQLVPLNPLEDPRLNYIVSFEYGLGAGFSWWPGIGFLTRNTDTQRNSLYPQVLTMGFGMGVVCCTGLLAGLQFRSSDPTIWMIKVGGPLFGVLSLLLVAVANVSASAMMMYTAALALRHLHGLRALPWAKLTMLGFVPVLAYVAFPTALYEKGNSFLTYNATMFGPISAVLLVDYFWLRRQRLNVSQIFEDSPEGHYWFWQGFNVPALVSVASGIMLYIYLLDPMTTTPHGPVKMLTASGPAVVVPMLLYALLAQVFLIGKGQGGYRADTQPVALLQPNL
jgi:NCS1 family nucleobase:cation symporter-1